MPLFVCDLCSTVDNTALGHYWARNDNAFGEELMGKALCSECSPPEFIDGTENKDGGRWHGKFAKRKARMEDIKNGKFINRGGEHFGK